MTYTIENTTNKILAHRTAADAAAVIDAETFTSEAELGELAASWPGTRLIEIWNALPGVTLVRKFKDRATGVRRVWKAIQPPEEAVVAEAFAKAHGEAQVTPESTPMADSAEPPIASGITPETEANATPEPGPTTTPEAQQAPDVAPVEAEATKKTTQQKKTPTAANSANGSREGSKTAMVLELMKREGGVTAKELMAVTGWQAHSVRGFISGTLGKKMGLTVVSTKGENGERTYTIQS